MLIIDLSKLFQYLYDYSYNTSKKEHYGVYIVPVGLINEDEFLWELFQQGSGVKPCKDGFVYLILLFKSTLTYNFGFH